jgi:hypothetical protein
MESHRNIEVISLLRSLKPDFKTIADFRRDNRAAFRSVFLSSYCFAGGSTSTDASCWPWMGRGPRQSTTRIATSREPRCKSSSARPTSGRTTICGGSTRAMSRKAQRAAARAKNLAERIEALRQKRGRYGSLLAALERTGESQISLTDPDSRAMAAHTKVGVSYNAQVAVDAKRIMIVEQAVTNRVVDIGLLMQTADPARVILDVERIDVVADRGCFKIEDIEACEKAGLTPHVPKPQRGPAVRKGFFTKEEFRYDPARDVYICPAGKTLAPHHQGKLRDLKKIDYSNPAACPVCPLRSQCTTDRRRVSRLENEAVLDDGGPPEGQAGHPRTASRTRRAPLWHDQAMDESRRFPDEGPRQCPG